MRLIFLGFVLALCQMVHSTVIYSNAQRTVYACNYQTMFSATYCKNRRGCLCHNEYLMASMMGCGVIQGGIKEEEYIEKYISFCATNFNGNVNATQLSAALELYKTLAVTIQEIPNFNKSAIIEVPIKVNETQRLTYKRSYDRFLGNYNLSVYYSGGILGYWGLVMIIAMVANWTKIFFPTFVFKLTGPIVNTYRKYVTLPAFHRKRNQEKSFLRLFECMLIPSRYESIVVFGFIVIAVALNARFDKWDAGDPVFPKKSAAFYRYVGDRSGITGTFMVPLLVLFAGRNNFLQFLTQIHYTTFITYHKWIARMATVLIVIHSITYTLVFGSRFPDEAKERFMIWGILATVVMCLMIGQAFLFFRRRWYEIFVLIHIVFSVLFIVGTWIHVVDFSYGPTMYATVAVWGFDRVVRIARLIWFGVAKARVTLVSDETLRIVVPKPSHWKSIPGGYAFIYFLRPSCFWQSHPFTFTENSTNPNEVILYCKVKGGVTHGLYQYLAKFPNKTATIKVSLEGPYGDPSPVTRHDTAVFVAGGNGIPGLYSEVFDILQKKKHEKQVIKLIWVIREYRSLLWFHDELLYLKNSKVQTTVYVTNPNSKAFIKELKGVVSAEGSDNDKKDDDETDDMTSLDTFKSELDHVEFKEGRPDMQKLVIEETEESAGSIAFVTCGHPAMVDDLRYSVAENVTKFPNKRVDFFEQLEVWA